MDTIKVKVLGTEYNVFLATEDDQPRLRGLDGFCDDSVKEIYVDNMDKAAIAPDCKQNLINYRNKVIRHELTHAMLAESGLPTESDWARNEEMVDWIAIQGPKLLKLWEDAKCL